MKLMFCSQVTPVPVGVKLAVAGSYLGALSGISDCLSAKIRDILEITKFLNNLTFYEDMLTNCIIFAAEQLHIGNMRYVKIPTRAFKSTDIAKYEKNTDPEIEEWQKAQDAVEIEGLDSFICLPLDTLRGCVFEPAVYINEEEEVFEAGAMKASLITTLQGDMYSTTWSVKELVNNFVKWGIVDESFKKEI